MLDMYSFADRRIARLSSGMKQKTSIARTIIHDPSVVVFDEPTTGLDIMTARRIIELIRSCREEGKTVIFSTHHMSELRLLCDDLAIIHGGKLYFQGTTEQFETEMKSDSYEDEFVRHKVLDAVGDLYLSGAPIRGHYRGVRAGHHMTNELLKALFAESASWRFIGHAGEEVSSSREHMIGTVSYTHLTLPTILLV